MLRAARACPTSPATRPASLSTTRTRRIAVVSEELTNPYYPELVEPLRRHLARRTSCARSLVTDPSTATVGLAELLADGSYDGVVLTTTLRDSTLPRDLTERGIPHVLVNRVLDHPESPSCTVDNAGGVARDRGPAGAGSGTAGSP